MDPRMREDDRRKVPMEENSQMNNRSALDKKQKIAIAFLSIVGVFFIVLWIYQLNQRLADPFTYKGEDQATQKTQPQEDATASLKAKDTDLDGLNDWDELNVYKTSPYLDDSDSDGILDGKEVKAGTDPNCPEGKKCSATDIFEGSGSSTAPTSQGGSMDAQSLDGLLNKLTGQTDATQAKTEQTLLNGTMDAKSLRKALLDSGMDAKILNALTDAQLIKSYQDTLGKIKQ